MLKVPDRHQLSLEFAAGNGRRTHLSRQYAAYPFHICRPFWLENDPDGMATLYLQSCSGGLYGGDRLSVLIRALPHAQAHVTTQASTIVYALEGESVRAELNIDTREGSFLEVFNDPLILFPNASVDNSVSITCAENSMVLYSDAYLAHDPEGLGYGFGTLESSITVAFDGDRRPSVMDRVRLTGAHFRESMPGASGRWPVHGSFFAISRFEDSGRLLRRTLDLVDAQQKLDLYAGGSELPFGGGIAFRIAARSAVAYRRAVGELWCAIREEIFGISPLPRRK